MRSSATFPIFLMITGVAIMKIFSLDSSAFTAVTLAKAIAVSVVVIVCVTRWTVCFLNVLRLESIPSKEIFLHGYDLKMGGINTASIPTEVIDNHPKGDAFYRKLIGKTVGIVVASFRSTINIFTGVRTITVGLNISSPHPTTIGLFNKIPKTFCK